MGEKHIRAFTYIFFSCGPAVSIKGGGIFYRWTFQCYVLTFDSRLRKPGSSFLFFMMIVSAFGSRCRFSGVDVEKLKLPNFYFWLTKLKGKNCILSCKHVNLLYCVLPIAHCLFTNLSAHMLIVYQMFMITCYTALRYISGWSTMQTRMEMRRYSYALGTGV